MRLAKVSLRKGSHKWEEQLLHETDTKMKSENEAHETDEGVTL